ncbi:hypothetical protein EYF80_028052 [Liparis tanakae]|uniref:Uncharacterized protein n=1 Tax=Liparis tanakae TaxID=230148 RepID=A0A4Z2H849_9TELE|nr:hypothetical protein EYF80_028052 [Liparis tanakae]
MAIFDTEQSNYTPVPSGSRPLRHVAAFEDASWTDATYFLIFAPLRGKKGHRASRALHIPTVAIFTIRLKERSG